jgi:hypothetical protein
MMMPHEEWLIDFKTAVTLNTSVHTFLSTHGTVLTKNLPVLQLAESDMCDEIGPVSMKFKIFQT